MSSFNFEKNGSNAHLNHVHTVRKQIAVHFQFRRVQRYFDASYKIEFCPAHPHSGLDKLVCEIQRPVYYMELLSMFGWSRMKKL